MARRAEQEEIAGGWREDVRPNRVLSFVAPSATSRAAGSEGFVH
ncbi:hypothetical protein SAMCFNEI73_pB0307 (plasmid) [Sinorhizobium americanum]|uniref:Uncharacterized protein n=1 Tax=Sinorhizobium americanum TaxID=194963 RepID=A0A1L3LTT5_9HYPH|nr:hypothetical protein SAMCFNEI73_pB0307 [Sinorhizobium americanum]